MIKQRLLRSRGFVKLLIRDTHLTRRTRPRHKRGAPPGILPDIDCCLYRNRRPSIVCSISFESPRPSCRWLSCRCSDSTWAPRWSGVPPLPVASAPSCRWYPPSPDWSRTSRPRTSLWRTIRRSCRTASDDRARRAPSSRPPRKRVRLLFSRPDDVDSSPRLSDPTRNSDEWLSLSQLLYTELPDLRRSTINQIHIYFYAIFLTKH